MINLKQFCSTDKLRPYLHEPFSFGEYTYATNGYILIRVPRLTEYPEVEKAPAKAAEERFSSRAVYRMQPLPAYRFPEPEKVKCSGCDGRGHEHDCPDCTCECEDCNGMGWIRERISAALGAAVFDAEYLSWIAALPGVIVPTEPSPTKPMPFTFDGGEGVLMPRRGPAEKHIEPLP